MLKFDFQPSDEKLYILAAALIMCRTSKIFFNFLSFRVRIGSVTGFKIMFSVSDPDSLIPGPDPGFLAEYPIRIQGFDDQELNNLKAEKIRFF